MSEMKTIKFPSDEGPREIVDAKARKMIGDLGQLETANKSSLVAAINEAAKSGGSGSDSSQNGATYTPAVSEDGTLSWTNDKGLDNPAPVNIKGQKGDTGPAGPAGERGLTGETGPQGGDGKSAYAYAQQAGYTGTEEEFAQTLAEAGQSSGSGLPDGGEAGQVLTMGADGAAVWADVTDIGEVAF